MKITKRVLAILLALALGVGLLVPALAAVEPPSSVDWDEFYITVQPQSQTIPYKADVILSIEVNVPEGVEVSYQWGCILGSFNDGDPPWPGFPISRLPDETEAILHLSTDDPNYPRPSELYPTKSSSGWYICAILGNELDEDGNVISSKTLLSDWAGIIVEGSRETRDVLYTIFVEPFRVAIFVSLFFLLPIFPIAFPVLYLGGVIENLINFFR